MINYQFVEEAWENFLNCHNLFCFVAFNIIKRDWALLTAEKDNLSLLDEYYGNEAEDMLSLSSRILNNRSVAEVAVQDAL